MLPQLLGQGFKPRCNSLRKSRQGLGDVLLGSYTRAGVVRDILIEAFSALRTSIHQVGVYLSLDRQGVAPAEGPGGSLTGSLTEKAWVVTERLDGPIFEYG
jgi:hypothetical protein